MLYKRFYNKYLHLFRHYKTLTDIMHYFLNIFNPLTPSGHPWYYSLHQSPVKCDAFHFLVALEHVSIYYIAFINVSSY